MRHYFPDIYEILGVLNFQTRKTNHRPILNFVGQGENFVTRVGIDGACVIPRHELKKERGAVP